MSEHTTSTTPYTPSRPGQASGIRRIVLAGRNSLDGLASCFKHEEAFRQEIYAFAVLFPTAVLLPIDLTGKALLVASLLIVLIVELLNTAVETTIDYISLQLHPMAKRAKDLGSAAVLLSLLQVPLIWTLVLSANWNHLMTVFGFR